MYTAAQRSQQNIPHMQNVRNGEEGGQLFRMAVQQRQQQQQQQQQQYHQHQLRLRLQQQHQQQQYQHQHRADLGSGSQGLLGYEVAVEDDALGDMRTAILGSMDGTTLPCNRQRAARVRNLATTSLAAHSLAKAGNLASSCAPCLLGVRLLLFGRVPPTTNTDH